MKSILSFAFKALLVFVLALGLTITPLAQATVVEAASAAEINKYRDDVRAQVLWLSNNAISITVSYHAAERGIERGISTWDMSFAVIFGDKYWDTSTNTRIVYDWWEDIALVVSNDNNIITTYRGGFKHGRWVESNWQW